MDYLKAFVVGGIICVLTQILMEKTRLMPGRIMVILVTTGTVLGAIGLYEPLVQFAGAGASVPLTGFGNVLWKGMKMGIIANYKYLSDKNLKELKAFYSEENETLGETEEQNGDVEILLDLDKMWDALHFVLTGASSSEPIKNNPFSEAVVGVSSIEGVEEFISYTEKSRVKDIVFALDHFDIEKAMENFSMKECRKANIYPDIWNYEEETDEIKEELMDYFQNLKDFYKKILEVNGNVMVTIC